MKKIVDRNKKEMFCYLVIFILLATISVLNNVFWKLGKIKQDNKIVFLESNNVIYNVPYEEKVLD